MAIRRKEKGKDPYTQLHGQALALIQQLAGKRWTDYNAHDPGVTLLDVFCYGLLDTEYRLGLDFDSYLPHDAQGKLHLAAWGLQADESLFADVLATPADYARLVKSSVANIVDCQAEWTEGGYRFRLVLDPAAQASQAVSQVTDLYYRHRNLGERLLEVEVVTSVLDSVQDAKSLDDIQFRDAQQLATAAIPLAGHRYYSLQYDMPACYGLGAEGIPAAADDAHRAQIYQLKGYMLLVDYLLSSIDQQVRDIPQLMGRAAYRPPRFEADIVIEGIDALLDRAKANTAGVFDQARMERQRLAFAEMCCVLYGEDLPAIKSLLQANFSGLALAERFNTIANRLPEWHLFRFRGMDITDASGRDMPTLKRFLGQVLGNEAETEIPVAERLKGLGMTVADDEAFFRRYPSEGLRVGSPRAGKLFKVPAISITPTTGTPTLLAKAVPALATGWVWESLLSDGTELANYRIVQHDGVFTLYCIGRNGGKWLKLAQGAKGNPMIEYANLLAAYLRDIRVNAYTFYVVEHVLLATSEQALANQRVTVVMPVAWQAMYGRHVLETWVQNRMPAHIGLVVKWLGLPAFVAFEAVYFKWKQAFRTRDPQELARQSKALERWL